MGTELEVKYAAENGALLDRICAETPADWREIAMESVYYDTGDGALSDRRWTLRLRRENGEAVICMKTPGTAARGVYTRGEWEWRGDSVEEAVPRLVELGAPPELAALTAGAALRPLCGARFVRRAAVLRLPDASLELALDLGELLAGPRRRPLCELEAEHKSGDPAAAMAFGASLARRYGLTPEPESKFQRALALARPRGGEGGPCPV